KLGPFQEADGAFITQDPRALPRAFFVTRWLSRPDDAALAALADLARSSPQALREQAVLTAEETEGGKGGETAPPVRDAGASSLAPEAGDAQITASTPDRVDVTARATAPGLLVLTDNVYPGWAASVQSADRTIPAKVLRCNYTFRGVRVPAGV